MKFSRGKPYHGIAVCHGRLTGTTDTDYFYWFCPICKDRHIMRPLDFGIHYEGPGGEKYPDERPKQARDFVIVFKLYCPNCKHSDFLKVGNIGWQGGQLPHAGDW